MGKIILAGSVLVWFLSNFPQSADITLYFAGEKEQIRAAAAAQKRSAGPAEQIQIDARMEEALADLLQREKAELTRSSFIGRIGGFIEPVFAPLGIDWRAAVALLSGFVAKEIVVSTLGVLHAMGDTVEEGALGNALAEAGMTPLSALSMMVFLLLYLPCLATTTSIRKETGSYGWMFFSIGYSTAVAWGTAFAVYQGGRLLGFA
jgi:ferrous iron transport protein B